MQSRPVEWGCWPRQQNMCWQCSSACELPHALSSHMHPHTGSPPATEGMLTMTKGHRQPQAGPTNPAMPCPAASPTPVASCRSGVAG